MVEASDLVIHHRVLQKFLQDSESGSSQPNSARVAKAREKLAKLSVSQFAELSTDVYDELQRRTTTSPSKPRFLQPKPTFHPKRNQAREKLASLQESRFRDLVKDIAFEVERRGFHQSVEQTTHVGKNEILEKEKFDNNLDILKQSPEKPKTYQDTYADESFGLNDTTDNFPEVESSNQKEVRSKLVVPKKSSLSWSSDEEEDVFPKGDAAVAESTPVHSPVKERLSLRRSKDTDLNLLMEESTKMDKQITQLETEKKALISENEQLKAQLAESGDGLTKQQRAWELEKQQLEQQLDEVRQNLKFKIEEVENAKQVAADWQTRHQNVNEDFSRLQGMYEDLSDKNRVLADNHANEKEKLVKELEQLREVSNSNNVNASETSSLVAELVALKEQHANLKAEHDTMAKSVMDHQALSRQYKALKSEHEAVKSKHESLQRSVPTHLSELETLRSSVAALQAENQKLKSAKPTYTTSEDVVSLKKEVMDWQKKYHAVSSGSMDESLKSSQLNDEYVRSLTSASGVIQSSSVSSLMASSKVLLLQIDSENLDVDAFFNNVSELATYAGNIATEAESNGILSATEQCRYVRAAIANFITAARYYAIYGKSIPKLVIQAAINDVCFTVCDLIAIAKVGNDTDTSVPKTPIGQVFPSELSRPTPNAVDDDEVTPVRPLKMAQRLGSASPSPEQPRSRNSPTPRMSFVVKPSPGSKLKEETSATPPKTRDVPSRPSQVSPSSVKSSILSRVQQFESPEKENKKYSPSKEPFPTSNAGFSKFGLKANSVSPAHSRTTSKDTVDSKTIPLNNSTASTNIIHNRTTSSDLQRKNTTKEAFDVSRFDIRDPDNTLEQLLHYLEHQTVEVIAAIQTMLASIKDPNITIGALRDNAEQILDVISQMVEATSTSMNQTRNAMLKEHGSWIVQSLIDCAGRMKSLCQSNLNDQDYADKNFKQRLAGVTFDIVRSTNELAKTVEEASLKEEIAILDARLQNNVSVVA